MKRWALLWFGCAIVGDGAAAELALRFTPRWKQEQIELPAAVENQFGQALRITRFSALVSGFALLRPDGSVVRLDGQFGFVDVASGRVDVAIRSVPEGEYVGYEFEFGLTPEVNHADPSSWSAEHPLNPLVNRLHWSWQGGYVFMALEGRWKASVGAAEESGASSGAEGGGFLYHLATDARRVPVRIQMPFSVNRATRLELAIDLARLLGPRKIDPASANDSTHSAPDDALAERLATALQRAVFGLGAVEGDAGIETGAEDRQAGTPATTGTPWAFVVPAGFPQPSLPADNPLTREGVALGAALFDDARLSSNGTQSCASCHAPARAFSDSVPLSRGAEGELGTRNAMPLFNLAWNPSFAWDGTQPKVRDQAHAAWTNPVEMNAKPERVIAALAGDRELSSKFQAAFGSAEITRERVTLALEQFLLSIVSADSKFDRAARGEVELSADEKRGFELFATEFDPVRGTRGADCFHCHGGALFSDFDFKNTGLDAESADAGRTRRTGQAFDRGKFKTPSLRNVALTAPYMHDGRFETLEEVVAHYDHGVKRNAALDPNLAKHPAAGLELSAADRQALVAFLRALTDGRWAGSKADSSL